MGISIKNNVSWVGKVDWELRKFHGNEYSTHRGSTYNSYLVEEEKTALIDTVWEPFAKEFVANLEKRIDLKKIDYVIANHAEIDHSGALPGADEPHPRHADLLHGQRRQVAQGPLPPGLELSTRSRPATA